MFPLLFILFETDYVDKRNCDLHMDENAVELRRQLFFLVFNSSYFPRLCQKPVRFLILIHCEPFNIPCSPLTDCSPKLCTKVAVINRGIPWSLKFIPKHFLCNIKILKECYGSVMLHSQEQRGWESDKNKWSCFLPSPLVEILSGVSWCSPVYISKLFTIPLSEFCPMLLL